MLFAPLNKQIYTFRFAQPIHRIYLPIQRIKLVPAVHPPQNRKLRILSSSR
jgi:hypothetical protein